MTMSSSRTYNTQKAVDPDGLVMPSSSFLEYQLLCDILTSPDVLSSVRTKVTGEMFTTPGTQKTWAVIIELADKGVAVGIPTVFPRIPQDVQTAIIQYTGAERAETIAHCDALQEMSFRRKIGAWGLDIVHAAWDTGSEFSKLLTMPRRMVAELDGHISEGAGTHSIIDVLNTFADELQGRASGKVRMIPTGIVKLDYRIGGGWSNGNLIVMASRPSVGKSALMLQMAKSASRAGFPSTVYSLEMPDGDLAQRMALATGRVSQEDITRNNVDRVEQAISDLCNLPLSFNTRLRTLDEICNDIVMQNQRGRCSMAFIDRLHIISGGDGSRSMYQAVTERTRRFKSLAMSLGIPIVLLCQLNRMSDTDNRPPELRDLRDSGSIEQDADIVLMLDRHLKTKEDPRLDVWVRKNRNGVADRCIGLTGERAFTMFTERDTTQDKFIDDDIKRNALNNSF